MTKIGMAGHNELGKVTGGQHGDQTGKEVYTLPWYYFGQSAVYRWKDRTLAKKFAVIVEALCQNNNIGYGQDYRYMLNDWLKTHNYDYAAINTPQDCDCSALVLSAINCVFKDQKVSGGTYTGNMDEMLAKTGLFDKLTDDKYTMSDAYLMTGDIINAPYNHVVIALEDGKAAPYALSVSATVKGTHKVGDVLAAADFDVTARMSDGSVRKNPQGWSASPLQLATERTDVYVTYQSASCIVPVIAEGKKVYRVQIGAFYNRDYAEELLHRVSDDGYSGYVVKGTDNIYRVQLGAFCDKANAESYRETLEADGYNALIV